MIETNRLPCQYINNKKPVRLSVLIVFNDLMICIIEECKYIFDIKTFCSSFFCKFNKQKNIKIITYYTDKIDMLRWVLYYNYSSVL